MGPGVAAVSYRVPLAIPGVVRINADAQHASSLFSNALNRPQDRLGDMIYVNGLISWDSPGEHWGVSLSVKNIFDDTTPQGVTFTPINGAYYNVTGDPRTALVTLSYKL